MFFHCHQGKKYNCYQDSFVVFCIFGFWLRKASQQGFHRWLFLLVVHLGFYRRETEKTKAFLTSLTSFQELHLRGVWVIALFCLVQFNGGVCSYSIPLPNAKPDRIQTNRKQGFKLKRLRTITLLSPFNEKCFCLKTFFKFWLSVKNSAFAIWLLFLLVYFLECGSKCPVNGAKIRLLYGYMACDLRLFAHASYSYTEKKIHKRVVEWFSI